jgi:hypothetical protein
MANGYLSDAFSDLILDAIFSGNTASLPTSFWVGLTIALPTDGDGTGIEPPDALEYGRVELVCEEASWDSMGEGSRSIETAVNIDFAVAETDWGQILGYTLYDAEVDGVYLGFGIVNPYIVFAGLKPRLPAGTIVVTLPFV